MRKESAILGLIMMSVFLLVTGCEDKADDFQCDNTTIVFCECEDGSLGQKECVDGELGECICDPPANAAPCAVMLTDESLTDNMTKIAECNDGEYVQCRSAQYLTTAGTIIVGTYCEKIFESGLKITFTIPYTKPDAVDCFLLNILCCNSDAQECIPLTKLTEADNGTSVDVGLGTAVTVTLVSNASTGYAWEGPEVQGDDIIGEVRHEYLEPDSTGSTVGMPGSDRFFFFIDAAGDVDLDWQYVQSWTGNPAGDTYGVSLNSAQ